MSETLNGWMIQYIKMLKEGKPAAMAMHSLGVGLEEFSRARLENPAFGAALALIESGVGATVIDVVQLQKLREAQVSEARCAAYFGMSVEDFQAALNRDKALGAIYRDGPLRGQANVQVAQYEAAVTGDTNMLKHIGEHYLDQKSKSVLEISAAGLDEMIAKLEAQLLSRGAALPAPKEAVEGEWVEVEGEVGEAELNEDDEKE